MNKHNRTVFFFSSSFFRFSMTTQRRCYATTFVVDIRRFSAATFLNMKASSIRQPLEGSNY
jgi:hypothetical protein